MPTHKRHTHTHMHVYIFQKPTFALWSMKTDWCTPHMQTEHHLIYPSSNLRPATSLATSANTTRGSNPVPRSVWILKSCGIHILKLSHMAIQSQNTQPPHLESTDNPHLSIMVHQTFLSPGGHHWDRWGLEAAWHPECTNLKLQIKHKLDGTLCINVD